MIVVGGMVTHNTREEDLERAVASLKSVSDYVLAFDDCSDNGTVEKLKSMDVAVMRALKTNARLLTVKRALLYAEAENLGADWFVYHDDDEAMSPRLQRDLRRVMFAADESVASVFCPFVNLWGDASHFRGKIFNEFVAWRARRGYSYYESIRELFENPDDVSSWHQPRPPPIAALSNHPKFMVLGMDPSAALLHYANSSPERNKARREWSAATGLHNSLNSDPAEGDVHEIPDPAPWE